MKAICVTICVVTAISQFCLTEANPNEQSKTQLPVTDPMNGKQPGQVRDDNGLKMKLVWCPPGKFRMGNLDSDFRIDNNDPVDVILTKGIWLGKYEVTQSEWKQVMATEPWNGQDTTKEGDDFPAVWISWTEAVGFCRKITDRERKAGRVPSGWEYTLPTEAQWERACRAQTETSFSFGDDQSKLGEYAWFSFSAERIGEEYAHRVGQKKPNPWGLYDMHGNVWEWCRDWYTVRHPGGRDPEVTHGDLGRVIRGGCWNDFPDRCNSACGSMLGPADVSSCAGFRLALSPSKNQ